MLKNLKKNMSFLVYKILKIKLNEQIIKKDIQLNLRKIISVWVDYV